MGIGGADLNRADQYGRTPLYYAAENGKREVVALLLKLGADRGKADKGGQTPLDVAADDEIKRLLQSP